LRLESDENLVKIVTIHKSKGLEYPVVFVPFPWDGGIQRAGRGSFAFHDPHRDNRAFLDLGSGQEQQHAPLARQEALAEGLRLLYVALTRARDRCYMVWGNMSGAAESAAAWLLHPPAAHEPKDPWQAVMERVKGISDTDLIQDLRTLAIPAQEQILIEPLPGEAGERYLPPRAQPLPLVARPLPVPPPAGFRVTSFSALATGPGGELPDYEAGFEPEEAPGEGRRFLDFPRGARAGRCLHTLLEHLDFTRTERADLEDKVQRVLAQHGFEAGPWTAVVAAAIEGILAAPLDRLGNLRLEDIPFGRRLNELEFYYPLPYFSDRQLRTLLLKHGLAGPIRERIGSLVFSPVQGFMKGYIDLIFEAGGAYYLADYKSNWLGGSLEAYREEQLPAVMAREGYYLQYLIYTVALHRYLALRLPDYDYDRHFGGVFYLFLRGMDPEKGPDYGVFRDRPQRALVEALDRMIAQGQEVV
ncbi:MAG: 3'-5' exonuclease, partial [Candidatus Competibacteraceae bacterium]|nr:3'-5' exonuclease [Candidatus Competibacteraceae bacterium]